MFSTGIALMFFKDQFSQASEVSHQDQWIEVKMAVSLPYTSDFINTSPQGKLFEYKGEFYNIVEQRYQNDTLTTKIKTNQSAKERFESLSQEMLALLDVESDKSSSPLKKVLGLFKTLFTQYLPSEQLVLTTPSYLFDESPNQFGYQSSFSQCYIDIISPPPKV